MPIAKENLFALLKKSFPSAEIIIDSLVDDNDHYSITIIDSSFANQSKIMQHKMVNKALESVLNTNILHAVQIKTIAKN
jgi:stress-induced morphogen